MQQATKKRKVDESEVASSTLVLFDALDRTGNGAISSKFLVGYLRRQGLLLGDPRLASFFTVLAELGGLSADRQLSAQDFARAIHGCGALIHQAVTGKLIMPEFHSVAAELRKIFLKVEPDTSGENAQYIPQLAEVNPDQFAISITTIDGQQFSVGDADVQFCIQSCSKPISYLIALRQFGEAYVHNSVGKEPSGRSFNEMCLKDAPSDTNSSRQIPHNPMINAGAIMACSMVRPDQKDRNARLAEVMDVWRDLSGPCKDQKTPISYDEATYRSESSTADRNWCLGYMMKERKAFPPCFTNLSDTLELYFQICSILSTCNGMSIMAATLANGGLNPLTGKRVFSPDHVRCALPLMLSSGMYDYSGQWSYDIGVPAKSGVGGCVFMVIPNLCGISIWSPRLDDIGNSARGVHVAQELVKVFAIHNFEVFSGLSRSKIDPRHRMAVDSQRSLAAVLFAASIGDQSALASLNASGVDLYDADYDRRTALHLAAAEGNTDCVEYLLANVPDDKKTAVLHGVTDRWGGTPLDDALYKNDQQSIAALRAVGMVAGGIQRRGICGQFASESKLQLDKKSIKGNAPDMIWPAATNNLDRLIQLSALGEDLDVADYDLRTSLHLAASNGHNNCIVYLTAKAKDRRKALSAVDRWGNTPHDDAVRQNHPAAAALLQRLANEADYIPRLADITA